MPSEAVCCKFYSFLWTLLSLLKGLFAEGFPRIDTSLRWNFKAASVALKATEASACFIREILDVVITLGIPTFCYVALNTSIFLPPPMMYAKVLIAVLRQEGMLLKPFLG